MPIVRPFNDEVRGEQGAGSADRSTRRTLFCFDPRSPLTLYEWGGHSIPEAPEYTTQDPQPQKVRKAVGSYNQTHFKHVDDQYIQEEDLNLLLPERRVTMAELIIQVQRRTQRNFIFFTVPNDDCPDACDRRADLRGESGRLGEWQETGAILAYDTEGDGGAITKTVMLYTEGPSRKYDGVRINPNSVSGLEAVYSVLVGTLEECSASDAFCPYQIGYAFNSDGVAVPAGQRYTNKWGVSPTAISGTALGAASIITCSVVWRGDLYVGYASAFKATSTAGGIGKSLGATAALTDVTITSNGIQALVVAGSRLHAFGEAGEWHYTSDGETWTTVTSTVLGSTDIFCAAYNPFTKRIYLGGAGGAAFSIRSGNVVSTITGLGSDPLLSVAIAGPDHVVFGNSTGELYENFYQVNGGSFSKTKDWGSGAINVILADKRSTNLIVACDDDIYQRSIMSKQDWVTLGESPDASVILSGDAGYEEHRGGLQYAVFGTADGAIFEVADCYPCQSS